MTLPAPLTLPADPTADDALWEVTAEQLVAFDPHWAIFWGDGILGSQLTTWVPYLRRSRYRYVIMSFIDEAKPSARALVAGLPNVMVARPFETVRPALKQCRQLQGVIYPTTRAPNFAMVTAFPRLSHIWVGHGESEKDVNGPRTGSLYDSVLVARYSAVNRFPRAIRPWVGAGACAIGAPLVEGVVKSPWERPRPVRTIVYAPTWEGRRGRSDYSSLPELTPVFQRLLPALQDRGIKVIIRPHPGTGRREPGYKDLVRELYDAGVSKHSPKADDFAAADLMISDVSGVTAEFLFTEKPVVMPVTKMLAARGKDAATLASVYPWAYTWDVGTEDLLVLLDRLARSDPLRQRRASLAAGMYRGHRNLDDAARTFDIALSSARWRRSPIGARRMFEVRLRAPRLFDFLTRVGRTGPLRSLRGRLGRP